MSVPYGYGTTEHQANIKTTPNAPTTPSHPTYATIFSSRYNRNRSQTHAQYSVRQTSGFSNDTKPPEMVLRT